MRPSPGANGSLRPAITFGTPRTAHPVWPGVNSPCATSLPEASWIDAEKSWASRSAGENAVRLSAAPISSLMLIRLRQIRASETGSTGVMLSP